MEGQGTSDRQAKNHEDKGDVVCGQALPTTRHCLLAGCGAKEGRVQPEEPRLGVSREAQHEPQGLFSTS